MSLEDLRRGVTALEAAAIPPIECKTCGRKYYAWVRARDGELIPIAGDATGLCMECEP